MDIRDATLDDIEWIMPELKRFERAYNPMHRLWPDEAYAIRFLRMLIENHVFKVAENKSGPVGFVAGLLSPHLYNPEVLCLIELFWWVIPEKRGGIAASKLMDSFIEAGRSHKAQLINFSFNDSTKANPKHLMKRGFRLREQTFILEI